MYNKNALGQAVSVQSKGWKQKKEIKAYLSKVFFIKKKSFKGNG